MRAVNQGASLRLALQSLKAKANKRGGWFSYINESSDSRQCFLQILALDVFNREAEGYNTHFTSGTVLLKTTTERRKLFCTAHPGSTPRNGAFY